MSQLVGRGRSDTGILWVKARDAAKILLCTGQPLTKNLQPKMSRAPRLRNLAIEDTVAMDIVNIVPDDAGICVNVDIDMDRHGHRHS